MLYLDMLPEELLYQIFNNLKGDASIISKINDTYRKTYNKWTQDILSGNLKPDDIFNHIEDVDALVECLEEFMEKFTLRNRDKLYCEFVINYKSSLDYSVSDLIDGIKIYIEEIKSIYMTTVIHTYYDIECLHYTFQYFIFKSIVNDKEIYVYIRLEYLYYTTMSCYLFTHSNFKELWYKIDYLDCRCKDLLLLRESFFDLCDMRNLVDIEGISSRLIPTENWFDYDILIPPGKLYAKIKRYVWINDKIYPIISCMFFFIVILYIIIVIFH